jgi:hypothetical protein
MLVFGFLNMHPDLAIALNGETYVRSLSICKKKTTLHNISKTEGLLYLIKQNHEQEVTYARQKQPSSARMHKSLVRYTFNVISFAVLLPPVT